MNVSIKCGSKILNVYLVAPKESSVCVLFLPGGSISMGKERYRKWQDDLGLTGISSLSFDYSGVNGSGALLEESSLQSRVEESVCVTDWLIEHIKVNRYILYGVSMGGYIALGLTDKRPHLFEKIILHAPAAYSLASHKINFGEKFTQEIRREGGWYDSLAFEWIEKYKNPILLIEAENDEIIPHQIIGRYKTKKREVEIFYLNAARHNVWDDTSENEKFRNKIYERMLNFISDPNI